MARREPLYVQMYGTVIARLTSVSPGQVTCEYTDQARSQWPLNAPLLSCSLPISRRPIKTAAPFFRGLLPEGAALAAVAAEAKVPTFDTFGILARFGRDVAGAAVISADDSTHGPGWVADYATAELAADVADIDERPFALHDDSELSLPGLQSKLLLVQTEQGWGRPAGGYPSTHILKVEDRRYPGLVTMEAACLRLARELGLTSVDAEVTTIADLDCLIVSRYDRRAGPASGLPERVHQEDVCQALGLDIDGAERRAKYQEFGGPGFRDVAKLLVQHAETPVAAHLTSLLRTAVFTYAIGNGDAHGKNLSLLHSDQATITLAPLYDTVPTALWSRLPDRAAMWVNGKTRLSAVTARDLVAEAMSWPMSEQAATATVARTADELLDAAGRLDLPDHVVELVTERAKRLLAP
ncbi:type II toxin-antitoxin system HipA family toxin [Nocardioides sp. AN3]